LSVLMQGHSQAWSKLGLHLSHNTKECLTIYGSVLHLLVEEEGCLLEPQRTGLLLHTLVGSIWVVHFQGALDLVIEICGELLLCILAWIVKHYFYHNPNLV
jgi:hypothetical protein